MKHKHTLTKEVERARYRLDNAASKKANLEKAERLNDRYKDIKPEPFRYSIEQAIGLPAKNKSNS